MPFQGFQAFQNWELTKIINCLIHHFIFLKHQIIIASLILWVVYCYNPILWFRSKYKLSEEQREFNVQFKEAGSSESSTS